jgi:hypothetical protein
MAEMPELEDQEDHMVTMVLLVILEIQELLVILAMLVLEVLEDLEDLLGQAVLAAQVVMLIQPHKMLLDLFLLVGLLMPAAIQELVIQLTERLVTRVTRVILVLLPEVQVERVVTVDQ